MKLTPTTKRETKRERRQRTARERKEAKATGKPTAGPVDMPLPVFRPAANLTGLDVAFGPTSVSKLLPPLGGDPKPSARAQQLVSDWFCAGLKSLDVIPHPRVDKSRALAHIRCVMASFDLPHERKTEACARLIDMWFTSFSWETKR